MGLYAFMLGLSYAVSLLGVFGQPNVLVIAASILAPLSLLAFALVLILGRKRLAARWFDQEPLELGIDATQLLRVALVVAGLVMAASGVARLVGGTANLLQMATQMQADPMADGFRDVLGTLASSLMSSATVLLTGVVFVWLADPLARRLIPPADDAAAAVVETGTCPECGEAYDPADYRAGVEPHCSKCGASLTGDGSA